MFCVFVIIFFKKEGVLDVPADRTRLFVITFSLTYERRPSSKRKRLHTDPEPGRGCMERVLSFVRLQKHVQGAVILHNFFTGLFRK
jgi:hypothetical protein